MKSGYQINQGAITCIYHYLLVILSMGKVFMGCVDVWKQTGENSYLFMHKWILITIESASIPPFQRPIVLGLRNQPQQCFHLPCRSHDLIKIHLIDCCVLFHIVFEISL